METRTAPVLIAVVTMVLASQAFGAEFDLNTESDFLNSDNCGEPFWTLVQPLSVVEPEILDAWTTKYPYSSPEEEIYEFQKDVDTLAFVVQYLHVGGQIPKQYGRAYTCGQSEKSKKDCVFSWSVTAPPGEYFLINFYPECRFNAGDYDWAAKVGDEVFGHPDPYSKRPLCFEVYESTDPRCFETYE